MAATPAGTPSSAIYLRNLGEALQQSHALTGRADQLAEAERSYARAAKDTAGAAYHRIVAYCEASALAERRADGAADALALAEAAVGLLPQLDLGSCGSPTASTAWGGCTCCLGKWPPPRSRRGGPTGPSSFWS